MSEFDSLDDMIEKIKRPKPKIVETKLYLHSSKESMADNGDELGLKGEAMDRFIYTFYEIGFDVEVDTETGEAFATTMDGVPLKEKLPIN